MEVNIDANGESFLLENSLNENPKSGDNKKDNKITHKPIIFGSCNRQNKDQSHWDAITSQISTNPELFVWTGDAIYAKNNTLDGLDAAYSELLTQAPYQSPSIKNDKKRSIDTPYMNFLSTTDSGIADGIWDDHDLGINDAGNVPDREDRAKKYVEFISTPSKVTLKEHDSSIDVEQYEKEQLWKQQIKKNNGMYHYRDIDHTHTTKSSSTDDDGDQPRGRMRMIFLDTRYARTQHWIPSIGESNFPFSAMIAAGLRTVYSLLGFGNRHADSGILGRQQWEWLENMLQNGGDNNSNNNNNNSNRREKKWDWDYTVFVSSIQVFTSNPAVENWSHYYIDKMRLVKLLHETDPPNVLFLSGDVHHGELITVPVHRSQYIEEDDEDEEKAAEEEAEALKRKLKFGSEIDTGIQTEVEIVETKSNIMAKAKDAAIEIVEDEWTEVTSSGMTHTCASGHINAFLCPLMLNTFSSHRKDKDNNNRINYNRNWWVGDTVGYEDRVSGEWYPEYNSGHDGYYIGTNIGSITFDKYHLNVTIHDISTGMPKLKKVINNNYNYNNNTNDCSGGRYPLIDTNLQPNIPDFYRFPRDGKQWQIIFVLLLLQCIFISFLYSFYYNIFKPLIKKIWKLYYHSKFYNEKLFGPRFTLKQEKERKKIRLKMKRKIIRKSLLEGNQSIAYNLSSDDTDDEKLRDELSSESESDGDSLADLAIKKKQNYLRRIEKEGRGKDLAKATAEATLKHAKMNGNYNNDNKKLPLPSNSKGYSLQTPISKKISEAQSRKTIEKFDKNSLYKKTANGGLMKVTAVPDEGEKTMSIQYRFLPPTSAGAGNLADKLTEKQRIFNERRINFKNGDKSANTDDEDSDSSDSIDSDSDSVSDVEPNVHNSDSDSESSEGRI
jgi:hypothetical protein